MSYELEKLFASKFINRPDVKARQHSDGAYSPTRDEDGHNVGWTRADITAHLAREATYGHYLLGTDDTVKLFCLDVDLRGLDAAKQPAGMLPTTGLGEGDVPTDFVPGNPREVWADRANPQRNYLKYSMRVAAHTLAERVYAELDIPVACAYSGNKGFHVYGFTGKIPAADARDGAMIVMDSLAMFEAERGDSIFKLKGDDVDNPFINFSIEVYPKQNSLAGKDLGNLLRLPLGRNTKSKDPTFFMDMTAALTELKPVDPTWALTTDNPWKRAGE